MKIGILTFHDADNYGAVLQAYALKETIKKIVDDVEILNYKQPYILNSYRVFPINASNLQSLVKSFRIGIARLVPLLIRKSKYNRFRTKYMDISKKTYWRPAEIQGKDVYIVGSDQVWNYEITKNDDVFFLTFCDENAKKIAYAASLGRDEITDGQKDYLKSRINNFDYISVREDSAVEIISELTDKEVVHVLDPTLLVGQPFWDKLASTKYTGRKYLLVYELSHDGDMLRAANKLAQRLNLEVYYITDFRHDPYGFTRIKRVGPTEFVGLFKNASFVVTNSFHGTAFSVIYEKNFVTFPHKTRGTRMTSLLKKLHLNTRIITSSDQITDDYPLEIDYTTPTELLQNEQNKSIAFLTRAING